MYLWKRRLKRLLALTLVLFLTVGGNRLSLSVSANTAEDVSAPAESGTEDPAGAELVMETVDLSEYIIQAGGLSVLPDEPMAYSVDEGIAAQATEDDLAKARAAILDAMQKRDVNVNLQGINISKDDVPGIYENIMNNNPGLFYVVNYTIRYYASDLLASMTLNYDDTYTPADVVAYNKAVDNAIAEAITPGMSDFQKARALHDYLVQHMTYETVGLAADSKNMRIYTAYNALVKGAAVCNGYTLAYAALLQKVGIEFGYCRSVALNHIWNYVKLDGKWYHVDTTWDDPVLGAASGQTQTNLDKLGVVRYKYFLCSDALMKSEGSKEGHYTWDPNPNAPVCDDTAYDTAAWRNTPSAILYVNGAEYYLGRNAGQMSLYRATKSGTETVCSVDVAWQASNGGSWPGLFSGLSYYNGRLFFNSQDKVYALNPESNSPRVIYAHTVQDYKAIYGSFVCGGKEFDPYKGSEGKLALRITDNPNFQGEQVDVTASLSELLAQLQDKITNKVSGGYELNPTYSGSEVAAPNAGNFNSNISNPTMTFTWYQGSVADANKLEIGNPVNAGNYILRVTTESTETHDGGILDLPVTIRPMTVTAAVEVAGSHVYSHGVAIEPAITVRANGVVLDSADYVAVYSDNTNAGKGKVTVTAAAGRNYTWEPVSAQFEIAKADYTGEKAGSISARYGNQATYDLSTFLPGTESKFDAQVSATADEDKILAAEPAVKDGQLSYSIQGDAAKVGKTAQVTVKLSNMQNYNDYFVEITVEVVSKPAQSSFGFGSSEQSKVYGDAAFTMAAQGAAEGSSVTYTSSNPAVAAVDASGTVQILAAGSAVITAVAAETPDYARAEASYTLTVERKELRWDISGLEALDREDGITDARATLTGALYVTGFEAGDSKVTFNCAAGRLVGTYADLAAGKKQVTLAWADPKNPVKLQGEGSENYKLPDTLPELTGTINAVSRIPVTVPGAAEGTTYELDVEKGLSVIAEGLKKIESLNTLPKIESFMKGKLQEKETGIAEASVVVYDAALTVSIGGGAPEKVTPENFPKEGLKITLPYPAGTSRTTHDYVVVHLFTVDMGGYAAGTAESPEVAKTDEGISFTLHGLSPIAIGWTEVEETKPDDAAKPDDTTDSGATYTPPASPAANTSASAEKSKDFLRTVIVDWNKIIDSIQRAKSGENINVMTGERFQVTPEVIRALDRTDKTLALHLGRGTAVSLSGANIRKAGAGFSLSFAADSGIPEKAKGEIAQNTRVYSEFSAAWQGVLPYVMNLHMDLGSENAGKAAYLYYYDTATGKMALAGSFRVTASGQTMFALQRSGGYMVVFADKAAPATEVGTYTVQKGDNLSRIAARNGISLKTLLSVNQQIKNIHRIYPGQLLWIPVQSDTARQ